MAQHALLSASSASRWMACPPSARLQEHYENTTSPAAAEGALAHEMGELKLKKELGIITKRQYGYSHKKLALDPLYAPDMDSYVDRYVGVCTEKVSEARAKTPDAVVRIEMRLNYSRWVTEGFGTGDFVIISDDSIEIIDLKYGKGIPVSAIDNVQMRLYALGAISEYIYLYSVDNIKMTIVQPRLDSISTDTMNAFDLMHWGDYTVKPLAEQAIKGEGDYCSGSHCIWCGAKAECRERASQNMELAKFEFAPGPVLSAEEIAEIIGQATELSKWAKDIQTFALDQALQGIAYPGWKVVEGKSSRKYSDVAKIVETLLAEDIADIYKPIELRGITDMEKTVGKKVFNDLCSQYVEKPQGHPVLTQDSDKREIFNSASIDFK